MLTEIRPPQKVAIIHDWLVGFRGGEKVLEAICELYPTADLFTLYYAPGKSSPRIEQHRITPSFLDAVPFFRKLYRHTLPLMPIAVERFDLTGYDLVISSSHCAAKGIVPSPGALHVCYCHTPMRYAWDRYTDYFRGSFEVLVAPFLHYLRLWDTTSAARVDHFIANSQWVKDRIAKYYRRDSVVINPFVDWKKFETIPKRAPGGYYLIVSGFAPNKRIDLAIQACESLNRPLYIVGDGQERDRLEALAKGATRFLGNVTSDELKELYAGARALLFPGEEDFGIAPLESMACGRPVIAFGRGGATETVQEGVTGVFFTEPHREALEEAILEFEAKEFQFVPDRCRENAARYTKERFQSEFKRALAMWWTAHVSRHDSRAHARTPESTASLSPESTP